MKLFNKSIFKEGGRNPHVDWSMILIVFIIIIAIFITNSVLLYGRVISGDIQGPDFESTRKTRTFNQKDFDLVMKVFADKADIYTKAKGGYRTFPDPSRP